MYEINDDPEISLLIQLENVSIRTFEVFLTMALEIWYSRSLIEHMQFIKMNSKICIFLFLLSWLIN